jgi:hypothetical protein
MAICINIEDKSEGQRCFEALMSVTHAAVCGIMLPQCYGPPS